MVLVPSGHSAISILPLMLRMLEPIKAPASGAAGIQLVSKEQLKIAQKLKVIADVNAVPPSGVAGLDVMADCSELIDSVSGAIGIGALAIGQVKYQAQSKLLKKMASTDKPIFLEFNDALDLAREYVSKE